MLLLIKLVKIFWKSLLTQMLSIIYSWQINSFNILLDKHSNLKNWLLLFSYRSFYHLAKN
jgi:hypothetical protein